MGLTMSEDKRCFVISPIGTEGSPAREHADDVFDYIIRPAADEFGIKAIRSDHLNEPGRISEQMFREILTSHCCLCVLTGHNPNVFYELAVAQSVGTPVIILIEREESLPFDIRDLRCVRYDLRPRPLFEGRYAREVVAHLRSLEAARWAAAPLLGEADLLRRRRLGLPGSLIEELSAPLEQKREALSSRQKQILFKVESLCAGQGFATQPEIANAFGKAQDDGELYYRLEHLRLLGFTEKRRDPGGHFFVYTLSPLYAGPPPGDSP